MSARLDSNATPSTAWKLASADLPRRVRTTLERLYALAADNLGRQLDNMLTKYEQQLFKLAEQAHNPALQADYFEVMRRVRLHRGDLLPRFLGGLETALATIREPGSTTTQGDHERHGSQDSGLEDSGLWHAGSEHAGSKHVGLGHVGLEPALDELRLVEDTEVSEASVLHAIAARHESRAGLPLMLLGQRFGVLAGAPAFDAAHLPVGPYRLCRLLAESSRVLQLEPDARLLLFESFNSHAMNGYAQLVEAMNALLARDNILPGLSYVPLRARPTEQGAARLDDTHDQSAQDAPPRRRRPPQPLDQVPACERPHTRWWGEADTDADVAPENENVDDAYALLQELMANRREAIDKLRPSPEAQAHDSGHEHVPLQTPDIVAALSTQQDAAPAIAQRPRTIADLKQALLAQGRQRHGRPTRLSRDDEDTFELLGLLYTEIGRELRTGAHSAALLERLQVPLLRLALLDRAFFVHQQHPARQLLNAVAEAGARWLPEGESDPRLERQLRQAVEHVVHNYQGDAGVFEDANKSLQEHLQQVARKAELSERRHVEAARGKEKLAVAKRRSADAIEQALKEHAPDGRELSRFMRRLLDQAWADVLTLTLLRHGEDSDEWTQYAGMTAALATTSTGGAAPKGLDRQVGQALAQVGYREDEAEQIARHLTGGGHDAGGSDDTASRTELVVKLKSHARLGDDTEATAAKPVPPRNPREQACYEYLRTLPFGTWMEFALNQQGDLIRRRIAWFSTVTDRMLFVNHRGQRVDEQSLDHVSRLMAQEQAKVVTADRSRLVDRAWQATLNALRNFTGMPDRLQGATP